MEPLPNPRSTQTLMDSERAEGPKTLTSIFRVTGMLA
jgi:hypothetical protein